MCCDTCNIDGVKLKKTDLCEVVVVVFLEMLVCVSSLVSRRAFIPWKSSEPSLEIFLDFSSNLKCTIEG